MLIHSFIDFILKYNQKEKNGENKTERLKQQKSSQSLQLNIKPTAWLHVQDLQWKDFTAGRQFRHTSRVPYVERDNSKICFTSWSKTGFS